MSINSRSSKKQLLTVGTLSIVLIGLGSTALLVQNRRSALKNLSDPSLRDLPGNKPPEFVARVEQEAFNRAKELRELWRINWAEKHKSDLLRMMRARPSDDSAWLNIISKAPFPMTDENLGFQLNSKPESSAGDSNNVIASWNLFYPGKAPPDRPDLTEKVEQLNKFSKIRFQKDMAEWQDMKISEVGSIAAKRVYCLWVSGRVTWRTLKAIEKRVGNETQFTILPEQQVLPPYDFLTGANSK